MSLPLLLLLIVIFLGSAATCHLIAKKRGANSVRWGVLGMIFGPVAIPFVFFTKPIKRS